MTQKTITAQERLVNELLAQHNPAEIFSTGGVLQQLKKKIVEKVLNTELEHELGYSKHSKTDKKNDNRRNGTYPKTLIDTEGAKLSIEVPRDRKGEYAPKLIPKGVRRFKGFDDKVISLYARGMTVREIRSHLEEIYQTTISPDLISTITDAIIEEVNT